MLILCSPCLMQHQKGKWEARIGQATGKKYKYLGLYVTEIEAAIAYDTEAVAQKGILAVTNFALSGYQHLMSPSRGPPCMQQSSFAHEGSA